ncbi:hypothetical protein THIX_60699 [Thiomonas sp. X19]|uniref:hypothetical protein n=1 Tax=Thiomonas sp. X19 TaxID=1050370 RepID=UPI000B66272D|nr:hypothetical protein [Thiomonas sp. X19]SCC94641.1 hypothetical protein THIX_60699 [Thiomonas sp. X19]
MPSTWPRAGPRGIACAAPTPAWPWRRAWALGSAGSCITTLLLKELGCGSNAARICELYLTDDLEFKRDFKLVGSSLPQVVRFVLTHTGLKSSLADCFRATLGSAELPALV